ncbi:MAG: hypothetical protein AB1782_08000 [Cyanobacteriota bacterium]
MIKRILFILCVSFLSINCVFADMKYTETTLTNANFKDIDAPAEIIQGMMANNNKKEIFYIKNQRLRIDNANLKSSKLIMCDKKQTISLEHDIKKYVISPFKPEMKTNCDEKSNIKDDNKEYLGQIKTVVTDTKKDETIGNLKAHKYSISFTISDNPSCMSDMNRTEEVWISDIKDEKPVCLTGKCEKKEESYSRNCQKKFKVINQGKISSDGLVVKRAVTAKDTIFGKNVTTTTTITDISKEPLPESLFEIPGDYTRL